MIRVVENKKAENPKYVKCSHCGSELEYYREDVESTNRGDGFDCPKCTEFVCVANPVKPFTFPASFYHFGDSKNTVNLTDAEIQTLVDEVNDKFPSLDIGECTYVATGNTIVFGVKLEDCDEIHVAKNYWSDEVWKNEP